MIRRGIGVQSFVSAGGTDADAQAFIMAAGITDATQQSAINTLVTDLKGYGIWSKMKAIYPFCGSTATQQKYNLKDPRDLDAAFRLVFSGGWTHSSTGALPNGINANANTYLTPGTHLSTSSAHISYYAGTANTAAGVIIGNGNLSCYIQRTTTLEGSLATTSVSAVANSNTAAFYMLFRPSNSQQKFQKNSSIILTDNKNSSSYGGGNIYLASYGTGGLWANARCQFASIGDGLTDTEAANFYTSVQKYQTTLGRHVGTPIVADSDAQAFLNAAEITSVTEANAVDKLVIDLKGYGIWSKMKAIWPMVGGTASTHKWNLRDPRDLNAAFRLVFSGGWTHSSTGALPNGTNAYADTFLNASTQLSTPSHLSKYTTTNTNKGTDEIDMGIQNFWLSLWYNGSGFNNLLARNQSGAVLLDGGIVTDARGFVITTKISNTAKIFKNNAQLDSKTDTTNTYTNNTIYLGAGNFSGVSLYSSRNFCFASIGDGLNDIEAANFYTAVQAYQTTLNRNI
jgi:Na+-transporting NADH:ubiquinone oxidoreductase subunit NqrC